MMEGGVPDRAWSPNQDFLAQLLTMGISESSALEALFCSNNESVEAAVNYVFNGPAEEEPQAPDPLEVVNVVYPPIPSDPGPGDWEKQFKMTFVVNVSLKMGVGKVAAQVAHACLGLYKDLCKKGLMTDALNQWDLMGEKKIVLRGDTAEHLQELQDAADKADVPCYLVHDAGHTQIPAGSVTVLSLFGEEDKVNEVTGSLGLL